MRIVTVLTSLGMGGAEKLALAVAERMARRGHDVALLALMPRLPEQWPTTLPITYLDIRKNPASIAAGFQRGRRFSARVPAGRGPQSQFSRQHSGAIAHNRWVRRAARGGHIQRAQRV